MLRMGVAGRGARRVDRARSTPNLRGRAGAIAISVAISVAISASLSGCSVLESLLARARPETPQKSAEAAQPLVARALVDADLGFTLDLPGNWRDLQPGDPAWVDIYGAADSPTELAVRSGELRHFALPVGPKDPDPVINLAVYLEPDQGQTAGWHAAEYATTLTRTGLDDITRSTVTSPAGDVERVAGGRQASGSDRGALSVAYILLRSNRAIFLVFSGLPEYRDRDASIFAAIVATLRVDP